MKRTLLLVDADPRSRRVLEVSLRKEGFNVTTAADTDSALETVRTMVPDLILADTALPGRDGFEFVGELRKDDELSKVPFVFLSSDKELESKVKGLELGVEYLTKPVYIREVLTRINLELNRPAKGGSVSGNSGATTRFEGTLAEMALVDLLQTIDVSRKSGLLRLVSRGREGTMWFQEGRVVDAESGKLKGEAAVYRFLVWDEGDFKLTFEPVHRDSAISMSTQALLMEGMRRVDEWGRLLEQVPPANCVLAVNEDAVLNNIGSMPDDANVVLRLIDGTRTVNDVIDAAGGDDLNTLTAMADLYFEGMIREFTEAVEGQSSNDSSVPKRVSSRAKRDEESGVTTAKTLAAAKDRAKKRDDGVITAETDVVGTDSANPEIEPEEKEEPMSKQAKRRRKSKSSAPPARMSSERVEKEESVDNVIQFPKAQPATALKAVGGDTLIGGGLQESGSPPVESSETSFEADERSSVGTKASPKESPQNDPGDTLSGTGMEKAVAAEGGAVHDTDEEEDFFSDPPVAAPTGGADAWDELPVHAGSDNRILMGSVAIIGAITVMGVSFYLAAPKDAPPPPSNVQLPTPAPVESATATAHSLDTENDPQTHTEPNAVEAFSKGGWDTSAPPTEGDPTEPVPQPNSLDAPADDAESEIEPAAAETVPESKRGSTPLGDYEQLLETAQSFAKKRKRTKAIDAYRAAIAANPNGSDALADLAYILLDRGKNKEAAKLAERATQADPTNSKAWITLGAAMQNRGRRSTAMNAYRACVQRGQGKFVRDCQMMLR